MVGQRWFHRNLNSFTCPKRTNKIHTHNLRYVLIQLGLNVDSKSDSGIQSYSVVAIHDQESRKQKSAVLFGGKDGISLSPANHSDTTQSTKSVSLCM